MLKGTQMRLTAAKLNVMAYVAMSCMWRCIIGLYNSKHIKTYINIKKTNIWRLSVPIELILGGGPPMLEGALCFMVPWPNFMAGTCGEAGEVGDLLSDVLGLADRFRGWAPSSCKGKTATHLARRVFSPLAATRVPITTANQRDDQPQAKGSQAGKGSILARKLSRSECCRGFHATHVLSHWDRSGCGHAGTHAGVHGGTHLSMCFLFTGSSSFIYMSIVDQQVKHWTSIVLEYRRFTCQIFQQLCYNFKTDGTQKQHGWCSSPSKDKYSYTPIHGQNKSVSPIKLTASPPRRDPDLPRWVRTQDIRLSQYSINIYLNCSSLVGCNIAINVLD